MRDMPVILTARLRLRFTLRGRGGRRVVSRDERTGKARLL